MLALWQSICAKLKHSARTTAKLLPHLNPQHPAVLHDLRVQIRTADSLLHPLLGMPRMRTLRRRLSPLKRWFKQCGVVRDMEARLELLTELWPQDLPACVQHWCGQQQLKITESYMGLDGGCEMRSLAQHYRHLVRSSRRRLRKTAQHAVRMRVHAYAQSLCNLLQVDFARGEDLWRDAYAWHQTRLHAKRLRYVLESYPDLFGQAALLLERAKAAQAELGRLRDWLGLLRKWQAEPGLRQCIPCAQEIYAQLLLTVKHTLKQMAAECRRAKSGRSLSCARYKSLK